MFFSFFLSINIVLTQMIYTVHLSYKSTPHFARPSLLPKLVHIVSSTPPESRSPLLYFHTPKKNAWFLAHNPPLLLWLQSHETLCFVPCYRQNQLKHKFHPPLKAPSMQ